MATILSTTSRDAKTATGGAAPGDGLAHSPRVQQLLDKLGVSEVPVRHD
jgi:hypothetical protein